MYYSIDMLDNVLSNEQKTTDPSVTSDPSNSVLDLQAVVARIDRLERAVQEITANNGTSDSNTVQDDSNKSEDDKERDNDEG